MTKPPVALEVKEWSGQGNQLTWDLKGTVGRLLYCAGRGAPVYHFEVDVPLFLEWLAGLELPGPGEEPGKKGRGKRDEGSSPP